MRVYRRRVCGGAPTRLIVEDAAKVVSVREDICLAREVGAPRVDKVDAGKPAGSCHLLQPQVLLGVRRPGEEGVM
jgi:hypothetical protein